MYAGRVVEEATVSALFEAPHHPYTQGLFRSLPAAHTRRERLSVIPGMVPPATDFPSGCRFRNRCDLASDACADAMPELVPVGVHGGRAACIQRGSEVGVGWAPHARTPPRAKSERVSA